MPIIKIKVERDGYQCNRCFHEWTPRSNLPLRLPLCCPKCNSRYWNTERRIKKEKNDTEGSK